MQKGSLTNFHPGNGTQNENVNSNFTYPKWSINDSNDEGVEECHDGVHDDELTEDVGEVSDELLKDPADEHEEGEDHDVGQRT